MPDASFRVISRTNSARMRSFPPSPPPWCIAMGKWPYHTQDWKDWLKYRRVNLNPPLPVRPDGSHGLRLTTDH
jgi:hypothetical protein